MEIIRRRGALAAALVAGGLWAGVPAGALAAETSGSSDADPASATDRLSSGLALGAGAPAAPAGITAASWVVADLDTGEVLAAQDAHQQLAPASTLKVLTALSLLPVVPPDSTVSPTQAEIDVEGSKVGLLRSVGYPAEELYASLLMVSGNDSANALAGAAGGQEAAAALMNAEATRLGALDTRAVNPHGLDAQGQVSTAYDLAVLGRAALDEPDIARWVTTRRGTMSAGPDAPRFEIYNKNKLLGAYEGALGVKNGYTSAAQASFIGAAERDGHRLVVSLMRAQPKVWAEAGILLDWGFAALEADAEPVGELPEVPEPDDDEAASASEHDEADDAPRAVPASASGGVPPLPGRQLAGALLVAAAVVVVRPGRRRAGAVA
jgi:serine-type D-Ala-D-Ala carboxypeptidase (penicillin-binding protein 5/6)